MKRSMISVVCWLIYRLPWPLACAVERLAGARYYLIRRFSRNAESAEPNDLEYAAVWSWASRKVYRETGVSWTTLGFVPLTRELLDEHGCPFGDACEKP